MRTPSYPVTTLALVTLTAPLAAQEAAVQPVWSEPYTVADPVAGLAEMADRMQAVEDEIFQKAMAGEIDLATFVRPEPVLQDITWDYGPCTDVIGLFPPPLDGWGMSSDVQSTMNEVSAERGTITYVRYDPDLTTDSPDFWGSEQSVRVHIYISPDLAQLAEMRLSNEMMRNTAYRDGPYGYPIEKYIMRTVMGEIAIDVSGTDEAAAMAYLTEIIGCGIDAGLIANGVDAATLRPDP